MPASSQSFEPGRSASSTVSVASSAAVVPSVADRTLPQRVRWPPRPPPPTHTHSHRDEHPRLEGSLRRTRCCPRGLERKSRARGQPRRFGSSRQAPPVAAESPFPTSHDSPPERHQECWVAHRRPPQRSPRHLERRSSQRTGLREDARVPFQLKHGPITRALCSRQNESWTSYHARMLVPTK